MRAPQTLILSVLLAFAACDDKSGDAKGKTDTKKADAKTAAKTDPKAADTKAVDAKAEAKAEAKADEAKADEAKADDAKADDAKAAAPPPPAPPAPATVEDAARQLGAWLDDPTKAGVPPLLAATGDIEIAEFCGACDDTKKPKTSKLSGVDAMTKKADELRKSAPAEVISAEEKLECKDDCCKFVPDPDLGVGDNVVNIEKICVAVGKDKKPTAYTKLETSGSY